MDPEKLIGLIRDNPVLYDSNDPDYSKTKRKEEVYEQIAQEMGVDSGTLLQPVSAHNLFTSKGSFSVSGHGRVFDFTNG